MHKFVGFLINRIANEILCRVICGVFIICDFSGETGIS